MTPVETGVPGYVTRTAPVLASWIKLYYRDKVKDAAMYENRYW
jgi:hypothetical protein